MRLVLTLFGGFEARLAGGPITSLPAKAQALLAYLALHPAHNHPRDKLAALLWGEATQDQARDSLRQTFGRLRRALDDAIPALVARDGQTFALDRRFTDIDVVAFERFVAEDTEESLERAARLYRGDLLEGLSVDESPFEEWLLAERERLRELAVDALASLLTRYRRSGATERAIQTAVRVLALEPLQEVVHRTLMRLYATRGRRSAALKQYQLCVTVLQRELGVEPEPETRQLYQEILRGAPVDAPKPIVEPARTMAPDPFTTDVAHSEAPLIGRREECEWIDHAIAESVHGRGQVVTIVGEAGIGKTRLIAELATAAGKRRSLVLLGRSFESTQILPFGPWTQILRARLDGARVEAFDPVWRAELARLLPEVGDASLPAPSDDPLRLFESVARFIAHVAARQPVTLVTEDLHWADDMSLRLFAFLGRRLADAPVLMVATAREEEMAPGLRSVLGEFVGQPHARHLALPPLSEMDTVALVRALARSGSDDVEIGRLAAQVWTASEGNPFVVVETMRALGEGPVPPAVPLPERVRQLVGDRLDRLSAASQEIAAVAAVVGRESEFELLRRACRLDEGRSVEGLEELVRRRILQAVGERFDFTHDRIRDVVHARLLPPRRRMLHAQVARAVEEFYAKDLAPYATALGAHYRESHEWDKASTYFRRAGAQAAAHAAHREAVAAYEQALDALAHLPETRATLEDAIDLRFDLRSSLFTLAEHRRIADHLREAESLATRLGDRRRHAWALRYVSNHFWIIGDLPRALDAGERGRAIAATVDDFDLDAATNFVTAQVHNARGDYRSGIDLLTKTIDILAGPRLLERCGFHSPLSILARTWLLWCLAETGGFHEGIEAGEEALRIAEGLEHAEPPVAARMGLGRLLLQQGDVDRAIPLIEEAREICQRARLVIWLGGVSMHLGSAYGRCGRLTDALSLLEPGPWRQRPYVAEWATHLAEVYLLSGRTDDARDLTTQAVEAARKTSERGREAWALRLLGEIEARRPRPNVDEAEGYYRAALARAGELGMRPLVAHCHLGLGTLHGKAKNQDQARTALSDALGRYREMAMSGWARRAEEALAGV